ncbi:MAG: Ig-like domain-containing protein [Pseudomonadota bacterium]
MQHILNPVDCWVARQPFGPSSLSVGNLPPIAVADTLFVIAGSSPVNLDVLSNDFDLDGTLSLVSASAQAGQVVTEADNTITYTLPTGSETGDIITYMIEDNDGAQTNGQVTVTIQQPSLALNTATDSTFEIEANSGLLEVVITDPAEYAGTYSPNLDNTASGPINLVAPSVLGILTVGETLTGLAGLWLYDSNANSSEPAITYQWKRGGVNIAGATDSTYVLQAADAGDTITVEETATGVNGSRSVTSAGVGILAGGEPIFLNGVVTGNSGRVNMPVDITAHDDAKDILVVASNFGGPDGINSITFDGDTAIDSGFTVYSNSIGLGWARFSARAFPNMVNVFVDNPSQDYADAGCAVYEVPAGATIRFVGENVSNNPPPSVTGTITDGSTVVAWQQNNNGGAEDFSTSSGLTMINPSEFDDDVRVADHFSATSGVKSGTGSVTINSTVTQTNRIAVLEVS